MEMINTFMEPNAVEIEAAVLGAILLESQSILQKVLPIIPSCEYFYKPSHQAIYEMILKMYKKGIAIDLLTVSAELRKKEYRGKVEMYELSRLTHPISSTAHVESWATIIAIQYLRRKVIRHCEVLIRHIKENESQPVEKIKETIKGLNEILKVCDETLIDEQKSIIESTEIVSRVTKVLDMTVNKRMLSTGLPKFDRILQLETDRILLLCGAAKHGKSRFTSFLVFNILQNNKDTAVLWCNLEESAGRIFLNYLQHHTKKDKTENITKEEREKYTKEFESYKIMFCELVQIGNFEDVLKSFNKKYKECRKIVVIDNVSYVEGKFFTPTQRDDEMMKQFVMWRKLYNLLFILIHHYSDEQMDSSKLKSGYRPRLKEIKGSEAYRRVPDYVLLINNPSKYPDLMHEYRAKEEILKHLFLVEVGANRHGKESADIIRYYCDLGKIQFMEL